MIDSLKHQIRREVMARRSHLIREVLLTDDQVELLWSINDLITASELAERDCISVQNASSKLKRLANAGYLSLRTVNAKSGGIEHVYQSYWNR